MSLTSGDGSSFTQLGVVLESNLCMDTMCVQLVTACKWKVDCIHRCKAFHTVQEQLQIFKAMIWSFLEYRTAAIYHCSATLLDEIDAVQSCFLRRSHISPINAAMHFNFLPLCTRRDIAMLGLLHRSFLGYGPTHFKKFFYVVPGTNKLADPYRQRPYTSGPWNRRTPSITYSALGLISVYNSLDSWIRNNRSVSEFQSALTEYVRSQIRIGLPQWEKTFCPRLHGQ